MVSASTTLHEIEREAEGEIDVATIVCQMNTFIQIMREVVPPEYHPAIFERLNADEKTRPDVPPPSSDPVWDDIVFEMGEDASR